MSPMTSTTAASLDLGGRSHAVSGLELKVGHGQAASVLETGDSSSVIFRCGRIQLSASDGASPDGDFTLDESVSPEDPAGEFVVDGAPYPIVGGTLHIKALGDGTAEVELSGVTEEIEFSGCDCVAREVDFKLAGKAQLAR